AAEESKGVFVRVDRSCGRLLARQEAARLGAVLLRHGGRLRGESQRVVSRLRQTDGGTTYRCRARREIPRRHDDSAGGEDLVPHRSDRRAIEFRDDRLAPASTNLLFDRVLGRLVVDGVDRGRFAEGARGCLELVPLRLVPELARDVEGAALLQLRLGRWG